MERIEEILGKREKVARLYNEKLKGLEGIELPPESTGTSKRSWFVYVVKLEDKYSKEDRDGILEKLREKGVGCSNYFSPIHLQPFYVDMFGFKKGDFPVTESVSERTIALPFFNNLKKEQTDYILDNLKNLL